MTQTNRRFSTGLRFLDRQIDGGIPVGGLLALTASPRTQSELLLYQLATAQPVVYISTLCPEPAELQAAIDTLGVGALHIQFEYLDPETLLDEPAVLADRVEPETYVVLDAVNGLEAAPRDEYLPVLNAFKRRLSDRDSIGVLHCIEDAHGHVPPRRVLTLQRADHVWQLQQTYLTNEVVSRLFITKARGYRALTEPIPLILTDRPVIDTSRNIA